MALPFSYQKHVALRVHGLLHLPPVLWTIGSKGREGMSRRSPGRSWLSWTSLEERAGKTGGCAGGLLGGMCREKVSISTTGIWL